MLELQKQWEFLLQAAVGLFAIVLVLIKGLNWILLWMDSKDWILIPNREALKNADSRFLRPWLEVQALVEPEKRQVLKKKDAEVVARQEDEEAGPDPPKR